MTTDAQPFNWNLVTAVATAVFVTLLAIIVLMSFYNRLGHIDDQINEGLNPGRLTTGAR